MLKKNSVFEVKIAELNSYGYGVCKIDGMAVFVAGAVPGDCARIRIIKSAKTYAAAKIDSLITPSPIRIKPECDIAGRCGGCVYSHVAYAEEAKSKRQSVENELRKAGLRGIKVHELRTPSETRAYRNKALIPFSTDGSLGYYAPRTHRAVTGETPCALLPDIFNEISRHTTRFVQENRISIYDEQTGTGLLRHLYMRRGAKTGETMVCLVVNGTLTEGERYAQSIVSAFPCVKTVLLNYNEKNTNVVLGDRYEVLYGDGIIRDKLCSNTYEIFAPSFYQINRDTAEALYRHAAELAEIKPDDRVADLYCGIGTIGLSAAAEYEMSTLIGVEIVPEAVENARRNAELNGIKNARFYCGDANDSHIDTCNKIFVDPPRKGLSPALISRMAELAPERVVYISCAPDTLARDIASLSKFGFSTDEIFTYDMFPRTAHTESLTVLKPKK